MACPFCGGKTSGKNRICDSPICRERLRKSWGEESIITPEGFMTARDLARKKGVSVQAVAKKCRAGKIPGAFQDEQSGRWFIPADPKNIPFPNAARRKKRIFKATDGEWGEIVTQAARTKHDVNEYILRILLGKPIKYIDFKKEK